MNRQSACVLPLLLTGLLFAVGAAPALAADTTVKAAPGVPDYSKPELLTGTVYEKGSDLKKALFTYRRTITRSNAAVHALVEFRSPDGALAARWRVVYERDKLRSCEMEELQTGAHGSVSADAQPDKGRLLLAYTPAKGAQTKTRSEKLQKDNLVSDMVAPFIRAHWDSLNKGATIKFRYVAMERAETVGFKLVKVGETTWQKKPVVRLKMEPTSLVIAALVNPLYFTVEKDGEHRVMHYVGRTTPKIAKGGKWEALDAETVYDLK